MANPFDDPDVTAAANGGNGGAYDDNTGGPPAAPSNEYGGGAYDNQPQLSQQQQEMAVAVGTSVAASAATAAADNVKQDYDQAQAQQGNQYSAPETPNFCVKLMMWFPIRYFAFLAGLGLMIAPILDWIVFNSNISFIFNVMGVYLFLFGIMIAFVESPVFGLTRKVQLRIFYWFRLLSRMWGRAFFYLFVAILSWTEIANTFTISFLVGIYLALIAILMFVFSRQSATKYRRIFDFCAQGADPNNQDELSGKLTRKFDELDLDGDSKIGSLEIIKLAEQAGRQLSNAERHAIQTFLDCSCNGAVSRDDFVNQFMNYNIDQKWL